MDLLSASLSTWLYRFPPSTTFGEGWAFASFNNTTVLAVRNLMARSLPVTFKDVLSQVKENGLSGRVAVRFRFAYTALLAVITLGYAFFKLALGSTIQTVDKFLGEGRSALEMEKDYLFVTGSVSLLVVSLFGVLFPRSVAGRCLERGTRMKEFQSRICTVIDRNVQTGKIPMAPELQRSLAKLESVVRGSIFFPVLAGAAFFTIPVGLLTRTFLPLRAFELSRYIAALTASCIIDYAKAAYQFKRFLPNN